MGMFDYVKCYYDIPIDKSLEYQTKDMDCQLYTVEIKEDGSIWIPTEKSLTKKEKEIFCTVFSKEDPVDRFRQMFERFMEFVAERRN